MNHPDDTGAPVPVRPLPLSAVSLALRASRGWMTVRALGALTGLSRADTKDVLASLAERRLAESRQSGAVTEWRAL